MLDNLLVPEMICDGVVGTRPPRDSTTLAVFRERENCILLHFLFCRSYNISLKGTVQARMKILAQFTHPQIVPKQQL